VSWHVLSLFFLICIVGVESKLGPLGTSAIYSPIVPAPGDCEDEEFDGMTGRGNRSNRRKPAPAPLCPPQIPLDQTRGRTLAAAVGSQRLTASAMAQPVLSLSFQYTPKHFVFKTISTNDLPSKRETSTRNCKDTPFLLKLILPSASSLLPANSYYHIRANIRRSLMIQKKIVFWDLVPWRRRRYVPPKRRF
jgi:hypothetical protein